MEANCDQAMTALSSGIAACRGVTLPPEALISQPHNSPEGRIWFAT